MKIQAFTIIWILDFLTHRLSKCSPNANLAVTGTLVSEQNVI